MSETNIFLESALQFNLLLISLFSGLDSEEEFLLTHKDICSQTGDGIEINARIGEVIVGMKKKFQIELYLHYEFQSILC